MSLRTRLHIDFSTGKTSSPVIRDYSRIYYLDSPEPGHDNREYSCKVDKWDALCERVASLGFSSLMFSPLRSAAQRLQGGAANPYKADPRWLQSESTEDVVAGLSAICARHELFLLMDVAFDNGCASSGFVQAWSERLSGWANAGAAGFRCCNVGGVDADDWRSVTQQVRIVQPDCCFLAWTPGMTPRQIGRLAGAGFDATFSSLPWWDYQAAWLIDEEARLRAVAPVFSPIGDPDVSVMDRNVNSAGLKEKIGRAIGTAAVAGNGVLAIQGMERIVGAPALIQMNKWLRNRRAAPGPLRMLSGAMSPATVLFRAGAGLVVNPDGNADVAIDWADVRSRLPDGYGSIPEQPNTVTWVEPAECRLFHALPVEMASRAAPNADARRKSAAAALRAPRIVIENVSPSVDNGRFAVKRTVGERVQVQADVFMDGHDCISASVLWREIGETDWRETPMQPVANDRWQAEFFPERIGRYCYAIRAWRDASQTGVLPADTTAAVMRETSKREFETISTATYPLTVDRRLAVFASWYELFPRSCSTAPGVHGTFKDVMKRLPAIRDMGFDVLYFPPIHPIGMRNRKGKNNSLIAGPDDPGSPYAIGSAQGGHDAIHPELGTMEDFRELLDCARRHDLEIALDFAIQCSPDHPWLEKHPDWFAWRADGSLRYAENPPKRYEDIVNPDFYSTQANASGQAALWQALRDIVLFWIDQGIRIFRVDNPHTKPLPFWQWMIAEVQDLHPDTVFLSEAFTRPKMMARLAKIGFSQSYTYFTWRNSKRELIDYLTELTQPPVADFFRPHFFVNTPDINPWFLQKSGRPGFLVRAALAATTSGLWGMYSGFELCEAQALPDKEEYLDSEKYELRSRDWHHPENIVAEISRLNQIRRTNPALQTHLGIRFHDVDDEQILFFSKSTHDNIVLAAICLDPRVAHTALLELPLWEWGLPDDGTVYLEDLFEGNHRFALSGKHHRIELTPRRPFLLWGLARPV